MAVPGHKTRIELSDDIKSVLFKLSDGNPGAITVLLRLIKVAEQIDPDAAMGPYAPLLNLDSFGIYGSRIWVLYKYVCGEDILKTLAMLRALQLGHLHHEKLEAVFNHIDGDRTPAEPIDVEVMLKKVKESLPNFAIGMDAL